MRRDDKCLNISRCTGSAGFKIYRSPVEHRKQNK
jgi:hypothetical protein